VLLESRATLEGTVAWAPRATQVLPANPDSSVLQVTEERLARTVSMVLRAREGLLELLAPPVRPEPWAPVDFPEPTESKARKALVALRVTMVPVVLQVVLDLWVHAVCPAPEVFSVVQALPALKVPSDPRVSQVPKAIKATKEALAPLVPGVFPARRVRKGVQVSTEAQVDQAIAVQLASMALVELLVLEVSPVPRATTAVGAFPVRFSLLLAAIVVLNALCDASCRPGRCQWRSRQERR
jgi:hypothetical protein